MNMSSISALQGRLKELSTSLAQTHPLVSRLRNFTTAIGQSDEARLELGTEIHRLLKEAETQLELLKVEVEALETSPDGRRKGLDHEKEMERERVVAMAGRLVEDLKKTRGDFRNAQLQAKRNAEIAKRKERELLFSRSQSAERKKQSTAEKLTQDEVLLNTSSDVTAALRRTHHLMQSELSRSQFAQETLEQSTAALSSLSESYMSLDTLLSSSRNLIGSLLRSQKSDTWYLETAFYILIGTIVWLLFRRILYGPVWWLVWLPIRLTVKFMFTILGAIGLSSKSVQALPSAVPSDTLAQEIPVSTPTTEAKVQNADGQPIWDQPVAETEEDRMIDHIGNMVEDNEREAKEEPREINEQQEETDATNIDDLSPEERQRQAEIPRNPKKRMYEATEVLENRKDEL